jgi:phage gp16-like protein
MNSTNLRQRDLARIHAAKRQLCLDDESYREMLLGLTGKTSTAEMNREERWIVIQAMIRLGAPDHRPQAPPDGKARLLARIKAQLTVAQRPWEYANAMSRHMFRIDLAQWCNPDQLRRMVAALEYDARRKRSRPD